MNHTKVLIENFPFKSVLGDGEHVYPSLKSSSEKMAIIYVVCYDCMYSSRRRRHRRHFHLRIWMMKLTLFLSILLISFAVWVLFHFMTLDSSRKKSVINQSDAMHDVGGRSIKETVVALRKAWIHTEIIGICVILNESR